jgi:hypothetical protein
MFTIKLIIFGFIILTSISRGQSLFDGFNSCSRHEVGWTNFKFALMCFLPIIILVVLVIYVFTDSVRDLGPKRVFISDIDGSNGSSVAASAKSKTVGHQKPAPHAKNRKSHTTSSKNASAKHAK